MSENTLIQKINNDVATSVTEIKTAGAKKVEAIQRETEVAIKDLRERYKMALDKHKAQVELVAVSRAKQAGNIAVQKAKRDSVDQLFSEVVKELTELPSEEYVSMFKKYAIRAIPSDVKATQVYSPISRETETRKICEELGVKAEVSPKNGLTAGFVLHSGEGVFDITLERIMGEEKANLEMEVIKEVTVAQ